jgi:hypothetical protein
VINRDYLIGEAKKEVLRMVDDGYAPPAKRTLRVLGEAAQGMVNAELFNMQAPSSSATTMPSWPADRAVLERRRGAHQQLRWRRGAS